MRTTLSILALAYGAAACGPLIGQQSRVEPIAPVPVVASSNAEGVVTRGATMALDGRGLYEKFCASCHNALNQSSAARASFEAIRTALLDIPNMQSLPDLDDEQIQAIVSVLSKVPPGKGRSKP